MPRPEMEPTVDGVAWSGFDRAARNVPGGARAVFQAAGVPLDVIGRPGLRVSFRKYVRYFELGAHLSGDPQFGFRIGSSAQAQRSGIPGHLVLNARRFGDAIADLARTLPALVGGIRAEMVANRDPPALLWWLSADVGLATQFTAHGNAFMVRMLQAHRGRHWRPVRVLYTIPEPERAERYRAGLGCPVVFGAPVNAIELRPEELAAERAGTDPHLHVLLLDYARRLLEQTPLTADFDGLVRTAIRDGLALGRADLTFVAARLQQSTRSLQRALSERGHSFTKLRDDERLGLARSLVEVGDRPIGDIATSLGYTETAAFSRAFRARFGTSPRTARRLAETRPARDLVQRQKYDGGA